MEECALVCGKDYLEDIAGALGVDAARVLNWGKIGKQVHAFVRRGACSEDDADQKLRVRCRDSVFCATRLDSIFKTGALQCPAAIRNDMKG